MTFSLHLDRLRSARTGMPTEVTFGRTKAVPFARFLAESASTFRCLRRPPGPDRRHSPRLALRQSKHCYSGDAMRHLRSTPVLAMPVTVSPLGRGQRIVSAARSRHRRKVWKMSMYEIFERQPKGRSANPGVSNSPHNISTFLCGISQ